MANIRKPSGLTDEQWYNLRLERMAALLQQSQDLIIGLGQYVPDMDPNKAVAQEVVETNAAVLAEENAVLQNHEAKSGERLVLMPEDIPGLMN